MRALAAAVLALSQLQSCAAAAIPKTWAEVRRGKAERQEVWRIKLNLGNSEGRGEEGLACVELSRDHHELPRTVDGD